MEFPDADFVNSLLDPVDLPELGIVSYDPPTPELQHVHMATVDALSGLAERIDSGEIIAIGVGSRGIRDVAAITETAVEWVRDQNCEPVIIPAMGSHGGGTAEGQLSVLAELGITEERLGCRIDARMETTQIGQTIIADQDVNVRLATSAVEADAVLPINRVAPHTSFSGGVESGICKMLAVGLGKREGARAVHQLAHEHSFSQFIEAVIPIITEKVHIPGGIAIIENADNHTAEIVAIPGTELLVEEPSILERAREHLSTLPFETIDLLIVDEMGKDISGTGMDPNVIDPLGFVSEERPGASLVKRLYVRSLSEGTQGNGNGVGFADVIHLDVAEEIDLASTYANVLTSGYPRKAALPPVMPTDQHALAALVGSLGGVPPESLRIAWIHHTGHLSRFRASAALLAESDATHLSVDGWETVTFEDGSLTRRPA